MLADDSEAIFVSSRFHCAAPEALRRVGVGSVQF